MAKKSNTIQEGVKEKGRGAGGGRIGERAKRRGREDNIDTLLLRKEENEDNYQEQQQEVVVEEEETLNCWITDRWKVEEVEEEDEETKLAKESTGR